ncbi:hypothetical protein AWJ20_4590 [Sugiyamaella lignohabitans]|uniref:MoaB/Mog domain-containing protein n=1 Tax=Sugiyamaella lignohabitans TaxID=796027 RepID=A0A161HJU9_9ASCO|nr:uncharacterized protein AWJ20_4590 [Sugiyamaella lignohabitans]ANB11768.1 hypothetical protein AWJ20_4590 [Sugiyamaella lignohabitans]
MSRRSISTAACLIIGDEILNGKIQDTNSNYFAKKCFEVGIDLKHITVVPDEEEDIVQAVKRLAPKYDFIVTSGGIGSTHDDITYDAIGKAFDLPVVLHATTAQRMKNLSSSKSQLETAPQEVKDAQLRMATLPAGSNVEYLYLIETSWVPVVSIDSKIFILPGVPSIFQDLLDALLVEIKGRVSQDQAQVRYFVSTKLIESQIAPYLRNLQNSVDSNIKIGSYPHFKQKLVTVSIIGPKSRDHKLREIVKDVSKNTSGTEISAEEEALSLDV